MSIVKVVQLDSELLIKEVEKRPCLYLRDAPRYNDPVHKRKQWEEIASIVYKGVWSCCSVDDKAEKVEYVITRWKSLRACFTRELKRQKDPKWIHGVAYKRRKYIYFNELYFLKSDIDRSNSGDEETNEIDLPEKSDVDSTLVTLDTNFEETPISEVIHIPFKAPTPKKPSPRTFRTASPPKPTENDSNLTDSDSANSDSKNFALSLVPMLNMLPIEKKIDAQIAVLCVLKKFLQNDKEENKLVRKSQKIRKTYGKRRTEESDLIEIKSEPDTDDEDNVIREVLYK